MSRLSDLRHRREILIEANQLHRYTQSSHKKILKYFKVMLAIRKEINAIECVNVRPAKAYVGMTMKELLKLTKK